MTPKDKRQAIIESVLDHRSPDDKRMARIEQLYASGIWDDAPSKDIRGKWIADFGQAVMQEIKINGNLDIVLFALRMGLSPNHRDLKDACARTLLSQAVESNRSHLIAPLIQAGANPELCDGEGSTPLFIAFYHSAPNNLDRGKEIGEHECLKILLENGAQIDGTGEMEDCRLAETYRKQDHSNTLLMHAVATHQNLRAQYILEQGADPNKRNQSGETAMHFIMSSTLDDAMHMVKMLKAHGADINALNNRQASPFNYAISGGVPMVSKALLMAGANPALKDQINADPNSADCVYSPGATALHHLTALYNANPYTIGMVEMIEKQYPDCWSWTNDLGETLAQFLRRANEFSPVNPLWISKAEHVELSCNTVHSAPSARSKHRL